MLAEFHQHDLSLPEHQQRHQEIAELEKRKSAKETTEEEKQKLDEQIAALSVDLPPPFEVMGVTENPAEDLRAHLRGDYLARGDVVPRGIPPRLGGAPSPMPEAQSGRLELARWIASPDNPLTARVIANRVWRWHFGRGIVTTPDNFGALGAVPTHPQLLDHLASVLVDSGWSIKSLHREIMAAATYQRPLGAAAPKEADPGEPSLRPLETSPPQSEALRDSISSTPGRLDSTWRVDAVLRPNKDVARAQLPKTRGARAGQSTCQCRAAGPRWTKRLRFRRPDSDPGDRRSSTVAPKRSPKEQPAAA